MIVKIIGMAAVFGACSLAGLYYGNLDTFCVGDLQQLKKALAILKSEIAFARSPLPDVCNTIAARTKKPVSAIFFTFSELLHVKRGAEPSDLWRQAVDLEIGRSYFTAEDREQLLAFGKTLGYLDSGMQLANITFLIDYLDERVQSLSQRRAKNKRLYQSLGALGGLLLVVLMI